MVMHAVEQKQPSRIDKAIETTKVLTKDQERRKIISLYKDDNLNDDPILLELVTELQDTNQKINRKAGEARLMMKKIQELAAKLQVETSELYGIIKYLEDKIVKRHHQLIEGAH